MSDLDQARRVVRELRDAADRSTVQGVALRYKVAADEIDGLLSELSKVPRVVEMVSDNRWTFEEALDELAARDEGLANRE